MKFKAIILVVALCIITSLASAQCPTKERESAKEIIKAFASHPEWADMRNTTNLSSLTLDDVSKLEGASNAQACQELNELSEALFSKYDVFYYTVKDKYAVVSVLKEPEDPDVVSMGLSFIEIYDNTFNRIKGYSF
ncbi:MAG TPA: hypothetical protein DF712_23685 [Balneola sp.]|nr:hypothetical protein [Bacteroidota bacterium]HCI69313.1 hypothetical protein [Balneola sp.]HCT55458.1 hypothetical protein [Balneola sp.]|tara:strand:- start:214 stop:621 length:408 start_codon:yes stop_codon:yes gene_type:complete